MDTFHSCAGMVPLCYIQVVPFDTYLEFDSREVLHRLRRCTTLVGGLDHPQRT